MPEEFAIALSEKNQKEAIREVSLKIKSIFPKAIKYVIVFFTPQYNPSFLFETIDFTLNPVQVWGLQVPLLIFDDKIIEKGIIACCINKNDALLQDVFIKQYQPQDIEAALHQSLKNFKGKKRFIFSAIPPQCQPANYLQGISLSLGKAAAILGAGFTKRYSAKNYQIINKTTDEGLLNIIGSGVDLTFFKISGFFPIGKPFAITRVIKERNIIMEINRQPAVNIYKKYLEDKFAVFQKNHLFPLYPIGIQKDGKTYLINIKECLEDGSLICVEEVKENTTAHLMLLHPRTLLNSLKDSLLPLKNIAANFVFMINSLSRKKILRDAAGEEIRTIHNVLGDKFKIFGIYCDYSFFPDKELRKNIMESGNLLITLWD